MFLFVTGESVAHLIFVTRKPSLRDIDFIKEIKSAPHFIFIDALCQRGACRTREHMNIYDINLILSLYRFQIHVRVASRFYWRVF